MTRILDAAASLIDAEGVDAATTRAIAERAGVAYPSLYRFFADREEIFDSLLERHLADLNARALAAEETWSISSAAGLLSCELDVHVAYYREQPSAARLWFGGRSSPTVVAHAREYIGDLAERIRGILTVRQLIPVDADIRALHLAVELGDRILDMAFRDGPEPDLFMVELGRTALGSYARELFS